MTNFMLQYVLVCNHVMNVKNRLNSIQNLFWHLFQQCGVFSENWAKKLDNRVLNFQKILLQSYSILNKHKIIYILESWEAIEIKVAYFSQSSQGNLKPWCRFQEIRHHNSLFQSWQYQWGTMVHPLDCLFAKQVVHHYHPGRSQYLKKNCMVHIFKMREFKWPLQVKKLYISLR